MAADTTSPGTPQRVLIIEDDPDIRAGVAAGLRGVGFIVDEAEGIADADTAWEATSYSAVVADRMVPDGDIADYVAVRRRRGDPTPVLFLTARDATEDRVRGFEVGADDYLTKPFSLAELVDRVRELCRRPTVGGSARLAIGDLEIDVGSGEVRRAGVLLPLTGKERCLLLVLADGRGELVSRQELHEHCWPDIDGDATDVLERHLGSLRRKLGSPDPIRVLEGQGAALDVA